MYNDDIMGFAAHEVSTSMRLMVEKLHEINKKSVDSLTCQDIDNMKDIHMSLHYAMATMPMLKK